MKIFGMNLSVRQFNYPKNIKTRKSKMAYWMFWQLYTRGVGQGQVIGRVSQMLPEMLVVFLAIERFTPFRFNAFTTVLFFIFAFFVGWLIGFFWMRHNFDMIDQQVSGQRNMLLQELHKELVKRRKKI